MSNLPVPIGDYPGGEVLWLDEKQVREIEADARLKLSNALIAELSFAIDNLITASGKTHKAVPRSRVRKTFRSLIRNIDQMHAFFSDSSNPEIKESRQRLESAIWSITVEREPSRKIPKYPLVETGRFKTDLAYLKSATEAAMDRIEREAKAQKSNRLTGSKKEVAFDRFLEDLEGIYRQAKSVRGSFVDFLLAVHKTIPAKHRPRLPAGWDSSKKK